jgi:hypothetical protein
VSNFVRAVEESTRKAAAKRSETKARADKEGGLS